MREIRVNRLKKFWDLLIGLSFKDHIEPIHFQTRWGIHTFFVKVPIDVFICDDDFIVRKIIRKLKPWRVVLWNPKYKNVIETPSDFQMLKKIKIGDILNV